VLYSWVSKKETNKKEIGMSESCKECRFFKVGSEVTTDRYDGNMTYHKTVTTPGVCRRRHVFVPHEPTDWCGEFKRTADYSVDANSVPGDVSGQVIRAAGIVNDFLCCYPKIGSVCGVKLA